MTQCTAACPGASLFHANVWCANATSMPRLYSGGQIVAGCPPWAIEFVETSLLDGSAIVKGTIAVGETVTLVLPDGSEVPAPNGEHTLEGDIVITVMDGVIAEVATPEEESPLNDEALMSKVNEALEAQANDFNNQIADIHSKYAQEIEALNAKTTALFSAVGILAKTEDVEPNANDAKRKSASVSATQFSRLTEILNKIK
jgi:hypothetical protein